MTTQLRFLERLGRACADKPLRTIGIWLVILIAAFAGHRVISGVYQNSINLHGTQASTGFSLLKQNDPASSGYTGLVVVSGVDLLSRSKAIDQSEANLAKLADVVAVSNPLSSNASALSRSGATALITVHLKVLPASLGKTYASPQYRAMEPATQAGLHVNHGGGFDAVVTSSPPLRTGLPKLLAQLRLVDASLGRCACSRAMSLHVLGPQALRQ